MLVTSMGGGSLSGTGRQKKSMTETSAKAVMIAYIATLSSPFCSRHNPNRLPTTALKQKMPKNIP